MITTHICKRNVWKMRLLYEQIRNSWIGDSILTIMLYRVQARASKCRVTPSIPARVEILQYWKERLGESHAEPNQQPSQESQQESQQKVEEARFLVDLDLYQVTYQNQHVSSKLPLTELPLTKDPVTKILPHKKVHSGKQLISCTEWANMR